MSCQQVLITGGAGFIGSHVAEELLTHGYRVRVLDNLTPQVHGPERRRPAYLSPDVELMVGDVRNPATVKNALKGVHDVIHLVAMVGVGQSMYEMAEYTSVNNFGTAILLKELLEHPIRRLLVASSMSIYGEGLYRSADGSIVRDAERTAQQLKAADWELRDEIGEKLIPIPTSETKMPSLHSVYALSKYDQERMSLIVGRAYGIPTVALRFFNAFGPYQALSNPYTGVLAIFSSRLLSGRRPLINEDGNQKRDFVNVLDVARACRLALESEKAPGNVFNVASGNPMSILEVARRVAGALGKEHLEPEITGRYRAGDIRHCFADISLARQLLGFTPQVPFDQGLIRLAGWLEQQVSYDRVDESRTELEVRGLMT